MALPAYTMGQINNLDFTPIENALGRAIQQRQFNQRNALDQARMGMEQERLGFDRQRMEQEAKLAPLRLSAEMQRIQAMRDELEFNRQHRPMQLDIERERLAGMRDELGFKRSTYPMQRDTMQAELDLKRKALEAEKFGVLKEGETPYVRDPRAPGGIRFIEAPENARRKLSPAEQKEAFEADDAVLQTQLAMNDLKKVIQLSEKAYDGTLARERAMVMNRMPFQMGQTPAAVGTEQLHNLITNQALTSLKTIFGAAPTEGERKILLEIQGSVNQPIAVRKEIFARANELAQIRLAYNRQKAAAIRSGNYLKPGFEMKVPEQPEPPADTRKQAVEIKDPSEARKLQKGQRFIYNGQEYEVQ